MEIGRNDWAAPEPVTGWIECFVNSVARVPACLAGSRGFDSRTRRQMIAEIAQQVERRVEGACVGGSKPSLGTRRQHLVSSADQERRSTKPEAEAGHKGLRCRALCLPRGASSASARPARPRSSRARGTRQLDVAKWSKASDCKSDGASPRPFEPDRRVHSPIAQWAEHLAVNQEVRGSKPRRGANVHFDLA